MKGVLCTSRMLICYVAVDWVWAGAFGISDVGRLFGAPQQRKNGVTYRWAF